MINLAASSNFSRLEQIYSDSFESNGPYFPPDLEEDEGIEESLADLAKAPNHDVFEIWDKDTLIGGAVTSVDQNGHGTLERLFIDPSSHGKGLGHQSWIDIENWYPHVSKWTLRTPTCLVNNAYFYLNKCGFTITKVEDLGDDGVGMFVFVKDLTA